MNKKKSSLRRDLIQLLDASESTICRDPYIEKKRCLVRITVEPRKVSN
ncbi:MAG: hypothetical protein ACLTQU_15795 [Enterococcus casseliflavus]